MGNREDADDIKQETFLRAFQAIGSFRNESSLLTWLLKICANLCRDRIRSWDRRNVLYHSDLGDKALPLRRETSDPAILIERTERMDTLHRSLGELPAVQREILLLHCVYDYRYDEIAEMLGCTRTGVKMRLFRARRALRESRRANEADARMMFTHGEGGESRDVAT